MPRANRRPKKKTKGYTTHHLGKLRHGHDFHFVPGFANDDEVREGWEIFREQVLFDWIRERQRHLQYGPGPGTRPWAWWEFDAPELLRRVDGKPHPLENPERLAHVEKVAQEYPGFKQESRKVYFGCSSCLCIPDDFAAEYETTADLLERHNLWLPQEKELLT